MVRTILLAAWAASAIAAASDAQAQVLRELDPIDLKYEIRLSGDSAPAGTAEVSFRPADTRRGRRLEVRAQVHFSVGTDPAVEYHETVTLTCDGSGVEKFETSRTFGEIDEKYLGIRTSTDYAVTATVGGEVEQKTETGEVQRSNLGLFCGGFLETTLDEGNVIVDYPLLFPALGRHYPRQKVLVGEMTVETPEGALPVIYSRLRRLGGKKDQLWHLNDDHQPLLFWVEPADFGEVTWSLVERNGANVAGWSEAIAASFPH